jgi:hypothetical protein
MISSEKVEKKIDNILNTGARTLFRNSNISRGGSRNLN